MSGGSAAGALALVFVGGAAIALQNLLLASMVARGLPQITALALNSIVGVALLLVLNARWYGRIAMAATAGAWQWWFLLPGLLGTFVVFAMLAGYTRVGAAAPTVALISGQVIAAVALDELGLTARSMPLGPLGWLGVLLFVLGAALVVASARA
jgi:bacterial/archaeal transporter family-2 protein